MGCMDAAYGADNRCLCPFCRTPATTSEGEYVKRIMKRVEAGDTSSINNLGSLYSLGAMGVPQDYEKAMELWLQAGELGHARAYHSVADSYYSGEGVEKDVKKAKYYYDLAAMGGEVASRQKLGLFEAEAGNMNRAVKHWMIAAGAGDDVSLKCVRLFFSKGHATKDDFETALRAHKDAKDELKSDQRDAAAAKAAADELANPEVFGTIRGRDTGTK